MKETRASPNASPILPGLDEKTIAAFPTGKPREEDHIESVICKTCKRPILKQAAVDHIRGCLKAKQEKARKKKEARDAANRAKEKVDGDDDGDSKIDGEDAMKGQKSAKKSSAVKGMAEDGTKKGKKRKADAGGAGAGAGGGGEENDKEPKKKKKKEEPKPKVPKPKGPVDVEKQCGVTLPNGAQCARSLTCKSHSMGAKRAVPGRSLPYDMLLQAYQKKNQARQQSTSLSPSFMRCSHAFLSNFLHAKTSTEAAIDANAPLQDDMDTNGPVDSDEEKDNVMAAIGRSNPQPIVTQTVISTKNKYRYVRIKEMLSHALGGARGGGLFSTGDTTLLADGGNLFQPEDSTNLLDSSVTAIGADPENDATVDMVDQSPVQSAARKPSVATNS